MRRSRPQRQRSDPCGHTIAPDGPQGGGGSSWQAQCSWCSSSPRSSPPPSAPSMTPIPAERPDGRRPGALQVRWAVDAAAGHAQAVRGDVAVEHADPGRRQVHPHHHLRRRQRLHDQREELGPAVLRQPERPDPHVHGREVVGQQGVPGPWSGGAHAGQRRRSRGHDRRPRHEPRVGLHGCRPHRRDDVPRHRLRRRRPQRHRLRLLPGRAVALVCGPGCGPRGPAGSAAW